MTRLLAFSGSTRADSFNQKLINRLTSEASAAGAEITSAHLGDLQLPIYNGDLEASDGLPAGAAQLKQLMQDNTGMIITCPEYNGSMTPILVNAIDWCTRSEEGSGDLSGFSGKTILIASASPGPGGGGRAATHLRTMLSGIGAMVFPQSLTVSSAFNAFDDAGQFKDEKMTARAIRLVSQFLEFTRRFE
jgi:NAD(P)H-dependent FMN reductase